MQVCYLTSDNRRRDHAGGARGFPQMMIMFNGMRNSGGLPHSVCVVAKLEVGCCFICVSGRGFLNCLSERDCMGQGGLAPALLGAVRFHKATEEVFLWLIFCFLGSLFERGEVIPGQLTVQRRAFRKGAEEIPNSALLN